MRKFRALLFSLALVLVLSFAAMACTPGDDDGDDTSDPELTGITVTIPKNSYVVGDALDLTGITVTAKYSDNKTQAVDAGDYTVSPANGTVLNTAGQVTVTVTYEGKEGTAKVTVNPLAVESIEITKKPDKTVYTSNLEEAFDPAGMVVTAVYNNQTTAQLGVEDYTVETKDGVFVISAHGKSAIFSPRREGLTVSNFGVNADGRDFWTVDDTNWTPFAAADAHAGDGLPELIEDTGDGTKAIKFTSTTVRRGEPFRIQAGNKIDNIAADIGTSVDGTEFRYSFMLKSTGDFQLMFLNGNQVLSDLSGNGSALQLTYEDEKFSLNSRAGTNGMQAAFAEVTAADYGYTDNEWSRVDMVLSRVTGNVTMKLYINDARVYFNSQTYAYGSFTDGNFTFEASPGNSGFHGQRFTPIPAADTEVWIGEVPADYSLQSEE